MKQIKRQQDDMIVQKSNNNKKQKLQNEIPINRYCFEDLANEILFEIFDYLDMYHIYKGFFNLNERFKTLVININSLIKINISTMSKSNFEDYYKNILLPNKHRINLIRSSNLFIVNIIFSQPRMILKFIRLEILILDNINLKYFNKIVEYLNCLPKFHSLTISIGDYIQSLYLLFMNIFRLSKLIYCKIKYKIKSDQQFLSVYLTKYDRSPLKYFIIDGRFPFNSLNNLLCCLPQIRHLSINSLVKFHYSQMNELSSIQLKYLKYISLKFDYINFDKVEKIIKDFFYYVQILRLTTFYDESYLNAKHWEKLISSYMPYLRIFDINHEGSIRNNDLTYHDVINQFNSSFWIEKKYFFSHQHNWQEKLDTGIFYSTNPYRRKDYRFYWELDKEICLHNQNVNLNSVKHIYIYSKKATIKCVNYFPNVTQLTIKHHFKTPDDSITTTLNRMIPLKQLTKLIIETHDFPFDDILKLLCFTSNLYILKVNLSSINEIDPNLVMKNEIFQYLSKTNKIKYLELCDGCSLHKIQLIVNLFSQLEYLKTRVDRKEIEQIVSFLLSKTNKKTQHLFFLCILEIPKICLKELKFLIKIENLLNDYFIKFINRDLYLWW
ncbi:unnamed protein product [Rotaria sp. Silwood2]|nr:unnamed protein product [Rotaria sp. Silwood2]